MMAHVHQGAIDVGGAVAIPLSVHQAKFSIGSVLGLCAVTGRADLNAFKRVLDIPEVGTFRDRVTLAPDPEVDRAYLARWIGNFTVRTKDGRELRGRIDEPNGIQPTISTGTRSSRKRSAARFDGPVTDPGIIPHIMDDQGCRQNR